MQPRVSTFSDLNFELFVFRILVVTSMHTRNREITDPNVLHFGCNAISTEYIQAHSIEDPGDFFYGGPESFMQVGYSIIYGSTMPVKYRLNSGDSCPGTKVLR